MDSNKAKQLLERYWAGETNLQEELQLRQYFTSRQLPADLAREAALFGYFAKQRQTTLSPAFEKKVLQRLEETPRGRQRHMPGTGGIAWFWRLAASLVLIAGAAYLLSRIDTTVEPAGKVEYVDTYQDPEKAFLETKKALLLISNQMSVGHQQVHKITLINEAEKKIKKQLKK